MHSILWKAFFRRVEGITDAKRGYTPYQYFGFGPTWLFKLKKGFILVVGLYLKKNRNIRINTNSIIHILLQFILLIGLACIFKTFKTIQKWGWFTKAYLHTYTNVHTQVNELLCTQSLFTTDSSNHALWTVLYVQGHSQAERVKFLPQTAASQLEAYDQMYNFVFAISKILRLCATEILCRFMKLLTQFLCSCFSNGSLELCSEWCNREYPS